MIDTEEYYGGTYPSPNWEDEKMQQVEIVCTVKTTVQVPDGFEFRIDAKDWIEQQYDLYDNKSNKYIFNDSSTEVYIDEIEYQTKEW